MIRYYCDKCGIEVKWPKEGALAHYLACNKSIAGKEIDATFHQEKMCLCTQCTARVCRWIKEGNHDIT